MIDERYGWVVRTMAGDYLRLAKKFSYALGNTAAYSNFMHSRVFNRKSDAEKAARPNDTVVRVKISLE